MKKLTQAICCSIALTATSFSTTAFAVDNCNSFYPKLPYNCVALKGNHQPLERADFSAFETGTTQASNSHINYKRAAKRETAKQLQLPKEGL
jgi:hypothetical protein